MSNEELEFSLDGLDLDVEALNAIEAVEPTPEPEPEPETESGAGDSGKAAMTADVMVSMLEAGFKSFMVEDFELGETKKAMIVSNFEPVLAKYDGGIVGLLGDYKEEGQALFAVAVMCFSMYMAVKHGKKQPKASKDDGEKQ